MFLQGQNHQNYRIWKEPCFSDEPTQPLFKTVGPPTAMNPWDAPPSSIAQVPDDLTVPSPTGPTGPTGNAFAPSDMPSLPDLQLVS